MAERIEIYECEVESVDDSVKEMWLGLAREMFEIEHLIVPSEANGDKWVEFLREGLASRRNFLLVAKSGSGLVGFAYASILRDYPFEVSRLVGGINDVYVLPEFCGRGIGKKLVVECLKKMKVAGVKAVRLQVLTENKAAIKL
jgi:ribosomal protein S18 acetylase RimI-like enzyme